MAEKKKTTTVKKPKISPVAGYIGYEKPTEISDENLDSFLNDLGINYWTETAAVPVTREQIKKLLYMAFNHGK